MNYDMLLELIRQFGYATLFFGLCLGLLSIPLPHELIVMTGGALTASGTLLPVPAFLCICSGVLSGLTVGYFMGRTYGRPILDKWRHRKGIGLSLQFSEKLMRKYGSFALCMSYFFPLIRHVMPYLAGINKLGFRPFAIASYTTGFIWTLLYFMLGRLAGNHIQEIGYLVYNYGMRILWLPAVMVVVAVIMRGSAWQKKRREGRSDEDYHSCCRR